MGGKSALETPTSKRGRARSLPKSSSLVDQDPPIWREETLSRLIVRVYEHLEAKLQEDDDVVDDSVTVDKKPEIFTEWAKFQENQKVTYTDDVLKNYKLQSEIGKRHSGSTGQMTTIFKELASLTTSLPDG